MKRQMTLAALVCIIAVTGCSSIQYGDGKVGTIPLDPLVQQAAKLADSKLPGIGAKILSYASTAKAPRVPPGYAIEWDAFLDGVKIDMTKIVTVPRLVPASPSAPAVIVEEPVAPNDAGITNAPVAPGSLEQAVQEAAGQ